jgi:hypothetical protein
VTSFEFIEKGDATIQLLHEGTFVSRKDMLKMEAHYINITEGTVNRNTPGLTKQESYRLYDAKNLKQRRAGQRAWKEQHKDYIMEKFACEVCGGRYTYSHKAEHCKSKKHQAALKVYADIEAKVRAELLAQMAAQAPSSDSESESDSEISSEVFFYSA